MDSLLKFKLELEDMMSGAVKKLGGTTHSVFEGIDGAVKKTQAGLNELGNEIKMRINTSDLDRAHEKMNLLKESAAMFLGSIAERGVEKGLEFVKEQVGDVLMGGMEASKTKAQVKVMAGDEDGEKLYEDIHQYIPTSMFGPELFTHAKVLLGMGEESSNIMTDIKRLADISMGDRQHMESIGLALGETISGGKFTAMQQRILRPTGFNPINELSRAMGGNEKKNAEKLTDMMAAGEFSVKMFRMAMDAATESGGRFYKMQEKISETPFGKKQIMETNIDMAKEELGVSLLQAEGKLMDDMKPLVDALPGELEQMRPALEGLITDFGELVKWTATHTDTIKAWFGVLKTGAEIFVVYKTASLAAGIAMNIWGVATKAGTVLNGLFTASEAAATGAVTAKAYAVTVASSDYAYYTTATAEATVATEALNTALLASPWGLIAAGIAGVAGSYALLKSKNHELSAEWDPKTGTMRVPDIEAAVKKGTRTLVHSLSLAPSRLNEDVGFNIDEWAAGKHKKAEVKKGLKIPGLTTDGTDAITGGGRKQIIIHANFGEHMVNHFNNVTEGREEIKHGFMRDFLEVLESADSAM